MRLGRVMMRVGMALALVTMQISMQTGDNSRVIAEGTVTPTVVLSQFKVTTNDGQFFTLYNPSTTASVDLGSYELEYFNNNDLSKATSSKIIPLSGMLTPGQYYMLDDGAATICYQMMVVAASLGFSTTSGFVEMLRLPAQVSVGTLVTPTVVDYVGWSKKTTSGNDMLTVSPSASTVTVATGTSITWLRQLPVQTAGVNAWQSVRPDPTNACKMQLVQSNGTISTQTVVNPGNQLATGQQPPSSVVNLASNPSSVTAPTLPAMDTGLASPQITELVPNPTGTGNDDTDEFVELYNPNTAPFDLTGFTLQTGLTTTHSYVFPEDTVLPAGASVAFYSVDTGLSLSNTTGQATLLDPFGNVLGQSDVYGTAKDGQSWSLAKGKWYWTTNATPNATNVIQQPAASTKTSSKSATGKSTIATGGSVKGASTTAGTSSNLQNEASAPAPIHPLVLAAIGVIAVGYGVYEYRHDIANKLYEFRRNRTVRRTARS